MFEDKDRKTFPLNLNLQLFAGDGDGDDPEGDIDDSEGGEGQNAGDGEKKLTFTQSELNALLKKNKTKSRNALLKNLGLGENVSVEDLQTFIADAKKAKEQEDGELKTLQTNFAESKSTITKLSARNSVLENQLKAIKAGVKPEVVDDVVSIALAKVDDDADFDDVIDEMKKNTIYSSFFCVNDDDNTNKNKNNNGTGNPAANKKSKGKTQTYAERLAEQRKNQQKVKHESFFKN